MAQLRPAVEPDRVREALFELARELRNVRGLGVGAFTPPDRLAFRDRYLDWVRQAEIKQRLLFADDGYLVALHTPRYASLLAAGYDTPRLSGLINDEIEHQEQRLRDLADEILSHGDAATRGVGDKERGADLTGLHPVVQQASAGLMRDGHHEQAVLAAFRAVEERVQAVSGFDDTGQSLMGRAFGGMDPPVRLATSGGRLGKDEQEGFKFLFMGAMAALRNLAAHGPARQPSAQDAIEALSLASVLLRRLDLAQDKDTGEQP